MKEGEERGRKETFLSFFLSFFLSVLSSPPPPLCFTWLRGPLCLLWLPARISWVQTCKLGGSHGSKTTSSKPAVFSSFVLFVLVLFRFYIYIFFWGLNTYSTTCGISYHFEILSSQVDPTKKEFISCPGQRWFSYSELIDVKRNFECFFTLLYSLIHFHWQLI